MEKKNAYQNGAFLICANHNSHMDTAVIGTIFCKTLNDLGALSAKDYWHDRKWLNFYANTMFNLIPLKRRSSKDYARLTFYDTIRICAEFLRDSNKRLVLYPEGTRSADGEMSPFKNGIAYFAQKLELPVIPVYINGTFNSWGRDKIFMRPSKIQAIIGEPVHPSDFFHRAIKSNRQGENVSRKQVEKMVQHLENQMLLLKKKLQKIVI